MPDLNKTPAIDPVDKSDSRLDAINVWLQNLDYRNYLLESASEDASFRRYFRMTLESEESLIVMDAPPEKESLSPFIEIAQDWAKGGIAVPMIHAFDHQSGLCLLEDFGSANFIDALNVESSHSMYQLAIDELIQLQKYSTGFVLPEYSSEQLNREMQLFTDWYVEKHCNYALSSNEADSLKSVFEFLLNSAQSQKQVTVHRDYHSRNLMLRQENKLGVIDFQDAMIGSISYDLVSLLKDCYIKLDPALRDQLIEYYLEQAVGNSLMAADSVTTFRKDFDLMGVQRHLKAIGIFCRLYYRDKKPGYLKDIPRTASYIQDLNGGYTELDPLIELLEKIEQNNS